MRPSEKFEAKAAGQKRPEAWLCATVRTFLADNTGIGLCSPVAIGRVIRIGSKLAQYPAA